MIWGLVFAAPNVLSAQVQLGMHRGSFSPCVGSAEASLRQLLPLSEARYPLLSSIGGGAGCSGEEYHKWHVLACREGVPGGPMARRGPP